MTKRIARRRNGAERPAAASFKNVGSARATSTPWVKWKCCLQLGLTDFDPKRQSERASGRNEAEGTILALDEADTRKRQMGTDQPPLVGGKLVEKPQPG
jgi:hypothetical protein